MSEEPLTHTSTALEPRRLDYGQAERVLTSLFGVVGVLAMALAMARAFV
jgi:hypothetical protein